MVVLDLAGVTSLDVTGLEALEFACKRLGLAGKGVVLCGLRGQPLVALTSAGALEHLGVKNVVRDLQQAAARARAVLREQERKRGGEGAEVVMRQ